MHKLILWVRQLRGIPFFKVSTRTVVIALMVAGAWVATRTLEFPPDLSINDKLIHAVVFFGFAVLMDLAISRHPFWLWKGLPLLIYGAIIEIMQYFSPDRSFSVLDWLADFSGILLYFILKVFLVWLDSKRQTNS
ncbi:MAG: VanZ family protein [Cocleimonas sp.]